MSSDDLEQDPGQDPGHDLEREKDAAAAYAADLVEEGMRVGLGTGSTVAYLVPALARRGLRAVRYVATSPRTAALARQVGLTVEEFDALDSLDIAIDGADQIAPDRWLMKGGGGAHTREKIVAAAAAKFVVIADSSKPVAALHGPVPLELLSYGLAATLRELGARVGEVSVRDGCAASPDGGVIVDLAAGVIDDPGVLAATLAATPGVVEHGLFPPQMVALTVVGGSGGSVVVHLGQRATG